MVIEDFAPDDFINLYLVEGLAYQYWRATAMMRTLGKGGRLTITPDGDWTWSADEKFAALIRSIDERTDKSEFQSSFVGLWFDLPDHRRRDQTGILAKILARSNVPCR